MQQDDARYYRHRAEVEIELAAKAGHPDAVAAHFQLAKLYFDRVEGREQPRFASLD